MDKLAQENNIQWGDAKNWDNVAKQIGITVDENPAVGSVAQTDQGGAGHVAYVTGVQGDTISIEDYNGATRPAFACADLSL